MICRCTVCKKEYERFDVGGYGTYKCRECEKQMNDSYENMVRTDNRIVLFLGMLFAVFMLSMVFVSATSITDGLEAYYKLDETTGLTATDFSGNGNDGNMVGYTFNDGNIWGGVTIEDGAMAFNGTTGKVVVANNEDYNMVGKSISLVTWWKPTDTMTEGFVINRLTPSNESSGYGLKAQHNTVSMRIGNGSAVTTAVSNNTYLNEWNFAVGVYDYNNDLVKIYVNGVFVTQTAVTGKMKDYSGDLQIGFRPTWNYYYKGYLDDTMVYSRALTSDEILAQYSAGRGSYALDGNGLVAQYSGRDYNATHILDTNPVVEGATTNTTYGKRFDGANDYILSNYDLNLYGTSKTISFWAKTNAGESGTNAFLANVGTKIPILIYTNSSGVAHQYLLNNGTSATKTFYTSYSNNTWYNFVIKKNNDSNIQYYVNGQLQDTLILLDDLNNVSTKLYLGKYHYGGSLGGSLDEVGVWSRALSEDEILYLYESSPHAQTQFSSEQVSGTTDSNITLSCTSINGCKAINYNINNEGWVVVDSSLENVSTGVKMFSDSNSMLTEMGIGGVADFTTIQTMYFSNLGDVNIAYTLSSKIDVKNRSGNTQEFRLKYNYLDGSSSYSEVLSQSVWNVYNTFNFSTMSNDNNFLQSIEYQNKGSASGVYVKDWEVIYTYGVEIINSYSFIYSGAGDHNIQFYSTDNADNNESINTDTFITSGLLRLNFYDDTSETDLNEVYLEFDGTPYYSDSNSFIYVDLNNIISGSHSILLQRTGYQQKSFSLNLNEYSDLNYNIGFIESTEISEVDFQVFTLTGATKPLTSFMVTDNDNNYLIDIKTTDSFGRVTFILNNQKSEYSFTSTDLNFGVTTWIINKPKDAITLVNITDNWKYSITGNSYSSATNIVAGVTKLLLQNTVNPYYIKIQDVNETYAPTTFGLKSVTGEDTKTLSPYLYPLGSADLKLIKLLDYATNQPIARSIELDLSVYTDSNGLIPIGTFLNDSTGTYNIYMDSNENYRLEIEDQVFELRPTLEVYYIYLSTSIGVTDPTTPSDVNNPIVDFNFPTTSFTQVSDYLFGCNINDDDICYTPTIFSLIVIVLLLIVFVAYLQTSPIQQAIATATLLTLFTLISFIPLWLFGITIVIIIAWSLFT